MISQRIVIEPGYPVGKSQVFFMHVTHIEMKVHYFMIAQKIMNASADSPRLIFEVINQPEALGYILTSVSNISENNQGVVCESPVIVEIDHIVAQQQSVKCIEISFDVRNHKQGRSCRKYTIS